MFQSTKSRQLKGDKGAGGWGKWLYSTGRNGLGLSSLCSSGCSSGKCSLGFP